MRSWPDPYLPGHGDRSYGVRHYDLDLDYRLATNRLNGRATLTIEALEPLDAVRLDLCGLSVDRVRVDGAKPRKVTVKDRAVVVRLATRLDAGASAELVVEYGGKPAPVPGPYGPAGWEELTDGVLVASQPYGAPSVFPCNDRADDKATYRITVTTDAAYRVVATGRLLASSARGGRASATFAEAAPTASYLVSLVIGRLVQTSLGDRLTLSHPARGIPSDSPFLRLPAMVAACEEWFGPYPFDAFDAVVVDDPLEIPLEAQAMATFGTNHLEPGWDNERLVIHELAHQWFGNAVTAAQLRDIWLHEGFACYIEWLWSQRRGLASANERAAHHWAVLAAEQQPAPLADPGRPNTFDDWVYKRGALTLHALRAALGDEAFFALCRDWVATFSGGSVATADFVALAQRHADAAALGDLSLLFAAWLDDVALPPCPAISADGRPATRPV